MVNRKLRCYDEAWYLDIYNLFGRKANETFKDSTITTSNWGGFKWLLLQVPISLIWTVCQNLWIFEWIFCSIVRDHSRVIIMLQRNEPPPPRLMDCRKARRFCDEMSRRWTSGGYKTEPANRWNTATGSSSAGRRDGRMNDHDMLFFPQIVR